MRGENNMEKAANLAVALYRAKLAAEAARNANDDDGGTCNLDQAYVNPKREGKIWEAACLAAGVGFTHSELGRRTCIWFNEVAGQADLRTRMALAFCQKMKYLGYPVEMYYAMD